MPPVNKPTRSINTPLPVEKTDEEAAEDFFKGYAENNTFNMPPANENPDHKLFKKHKKSKKKK